MTRLLLLLPLLAASCVECPYEARARRDKPAEFVPPRETAPRPPMR